MWSHLQKTAPQSLGILVRGINFNEKMLRVANFEAQVPWPSSEQTFLLNESPKLFLG